MTVLSFLSNLSRRLVLSGDEKCSIAVSLNMMHSHFKNWDHSCYVINKFHFGSYQRETILPRWADADSDVDFMVVFNNPYNYQPQTFLNWLRAFAESKYPLSFKRQSFPTVVVELNHIKFEIVPAINSWGYKIPTKESYYNSWEPTDPLLLKDKVTSANLLNSNVRPLIRIMKYWNARNGKPFASFKLETMIAEHFYWGCTNLEDCFYSFVNSLVVNYYLPENKKRLINSIKYKVKLAKQYKNNGNVNQAVLTIASIFD